MGRGWRLPPDGDVIRAMASGDVQIGEAGSSPFAAAVSQGQNLNLFWILDDIDAAFIWDPVLSKIKTNGKTIATSGSIGKKGYPTFDGLVVDATWAKANEGFMVALVKALARADTAVFLKEQGRVQEVKPSYAAYVNSSFVHSRRLPGQAWAIKRSRAAALSLRSPSRRSMVAPRSARWRSGGRLKCAPFRR
jgi:ABC-type taurine transport system substrate-binding protein